MPHFFNTPHAFKKIGEMQSGEKQFGQMHHTRLCQFKSEDNIKVIAPINKETDEEERLFCVI